MSKKKKKKKKTSKESARRVNQFGKIDWDANKHLLGTMTDGRVGEILGVTGSAVHAARKKMGIPAWQPKPDDTVKRGFWDSQPLGKMSDKMLGLMLAIPTKRVTRARMRRKIPPYRKRGGWTND